MYYIVLMTGLVFSLFNKKFFFWALFSILLTMAFLRYGIGADYFSYEYLFLRLFESVIYEFKYGIDNQEIGFRLIGSFFKSIGLSYEQYLMFFASLNLIFVAKICKKYSRNPTLSLVLYFCFYYLTWTFGGIRQGVTLAIGMYYFLECLDNKNPKKLYITAILLSFIHTSALVLIPLYIFSKMRFNKGNLILIFLISLIVSFLPTGALISKLTWVPFVDRIIPYLNYEMSFNVPGFQEFARLIFVIIAFVFYKSYVQQNELSEKIMNIYIISFIIYFTLQFSELTAARLSIYGKFLDILILSNILYIYKTSLTKAIYLYFLFILCFSYLTKDLSAMEKNFENQNSNSIITPYVNIYNKDEFEFKSEYYQLND